MKIRIFKETKFIIISQVLLIIFLGILTGNLNSVKNALTDRNKLDSVNSISIDFRGLENNDFYEIINELKKEDNIILKYYNMMIFETKTEETGNIQGIYINDDYFIDLKLKWGRLFTKEDMNSDVGLAVIGENIEKYTLKEKGKQYVISGNDKFEVIGVLEKTKGFNNSDFILYNLDSIINKPYKLNKSDWLIDSKKYTNRELIDIVQSVANNYEGEVRAFEYGLRFNKDTHIFILASMIIAFLLTALTILMSLIRALIMWVNYIALELGVRITNGARRRDIILLVINRYSQSTIISLAIAILGIYVLTLMDIRIIYFKFKFYIIWVLITISFFIGLVILLFLVNGLRRISISQLLKERN